MKDNIEIQMIINFFRKSLLCAIILALVLASVPISNASANWNGQFTLSSATYSKGESGGTVSITIKLSGSRTGKKPWSAQVNYATSDGTATPVAITRQPRE